MNKHEEELIESKKSLYEVLGCLVWVIIAAIICNLF